MKTKTVKRQNTQPRHWTRSCEGAIVWEPHGGVALVCGLPEERGQARLILVTRHNVCPTDPRHMIRISNARYRPPWQSDRQWHCTLFSPNWVTKCLTRVSIWRQVFVPYTMTLISALKKKDFKRGEQDSWNCGTWLNCVTDRQTARWCRKRHIKTFCTGQATVTKRNVNNQLST